jgi:hypothetical protein
MIVSDIIMDGSILVGSGFEVILSKGLGRHFQQGEKSAYFRTPKTLPIFYRRSWTGERKR